MQTISSEDVFMAQNMEVFDLKGVYYIFSTRIRCHVCDLSYVSSSDNAMAFYPRQIVEEFPAYNPYEPILGMNRKNFNTIHIYPL